MAFSFLTILSFSMICLVVGWVVFHKKSIAVALTNVILIMLITQSFFGNDTILGREEIKNSFDCVLGVGTSARMIRGMILPISCILCYLTYKLCLQMCSRFQRLTKYKKIIIVCGIGIISGFSFIWSNDYGISCWVCMAIMTFIIILFRTKKIWKAVIATMLEVVVSFISIFLFVEIFTLGHFSSWFNFTLGTGGYQSWYYNSPKSFYLFDIDTSYITLVQGILCIVYLILLFKHKADMESLIRYGTLLFFNMVCFCAVNEYKLLSGGSSAEVAFLVLFVTILFEVLGFLKSLVNAHINKNIIYIVTLITSFTWIFLYITAEIGYWKLIDKDGEYIEAMGGNVISYGTDLLDAAQFIGNNKYFATYASAQEVVTDTFQPSGTDYIIHVLGDKQREKYLNSFINGNFKYAVTIKENFSLYEYWVERANWFFYRELYRNWHPVYANTYEMYWERNVKNEQNILTNACSVQVEDVDASTKKIIVKADTTVNGIADVYIDYEIKKTDSQLGKFLFHSMLNVKNTGKVFCEEDGYDENYLRNTGNEFIPVRVTDGYGEITLTSLPEICTKLELYTVTCSEIYQVVFDYVECSNIEITENGIVINALNTLKNETSLKNAVKIIINGDEYPISEVQSDENNLCIKISSHELQHSLENYSKYNNVLQIVKEK